MTLFLSQYELDLSDLERKIQMKAELLEPIMSIIMNAGNAKSTGFEALNAAKEGNFEEAEAKIKEAREALVDSHRGQTALLTKEASGEQFDVSLLLIHSQDHLMNAITFLDLPPALIELYQPLAAK